MKWYKLLSYKKKKRNVINVIWEREIISNFTKLSFINDIRKIN